MPSTTVPFLTSTSYDMVPSLSFRFTYLLPYSSRLVPVVRPDTGCEQMGLGSGLHIDLFWSLPEVPPWRASGASNSPEPSILSWEKGNGVRLCYLNNAAVGEQRVGRGATPSPVCPGPPLSCQRLRQPAVKARSDARCHWWLAARPGNEFPGYRHDIVKRWGGCRSVALEGRPAFEGR